MLLIAAACRTVSAAAFVPGQYLECDGFQTRECYEDGTVHWQLSGETARIQGVLAEITGAELVLNLPDREPLRIWSPKCVFNERTRVGESDGPLRVQTENMVLEGVGYDVVARAGQERLRLRSRVRMRIRNQDRVRRELDILPLLRPAKEPQAAAAATDREP